MKISELRQVARSQGLKSWTALRKNDLRNFLINNGSRPLTSKPKRLSMAEHFAKQNPPTPSTNASLDRIKKLEEKNRELRQ